MTDLIRECEGAARIGISAHLKPDGDAVGSCLGLWNYLRSAFPQAEVVVCLQKPSDDFRELPGFDRILQEFPAGTEPFDVYFALDCNRERLGDVAGAYFDSARKKINIDHHVSNPGEGDVNLVEPEISSTAELLYTLMDRKLVNRDTAECLYVGMIHDTGVFQYSCTSPDTMRRAAELMEYGFEFSRIIRETFYEKTYLQAQIMGRCLMESVRFMDGRCIVSVVDRKTMGFYNVTSTDFEGIVNQLLNIRGVEVALFLYETEPMEFKVSMRSKERVDVSKVAMYFNGGGHVRAAGCTMKGTFYDCVNNLSEQIALQLEAPADSNE